MAWQTLSLLLIATLCIHIHTTDARAIEQEIDDELTMEDAEQIATLLNYRHRFEHSNNSKSIEMDVSRTGESKGRLLQSVPHSSPPL